MKTPEEIKKGLREAPHVKYFADDPISADGRNVRYGVVIGYVLREEIVALIERLAQAEEALAFERAYREDQAVSWELKCSLLEREAAQSERERDAAVFDLWGDCCYCAHNSLADTKCIERCKRCKHAPDAEERDEIGVDRWEWRGVSEGVAK